MVLLSRLPAPVGQALLRLEQHGFEAYLVGGCIRDAMLGKTPHDWDIATNARPAQVRRAFADYPVLETGLAHGTVTVLLDHFPLEVTTYRIDGGYQDHRHPSQVQFTPSIRQDLARRDFTVNAMAWSPERGLVDPFSGERDLRAATLRCVGEPRARLEEDALRILRAIRFSSELGFSIEPATARAIHQTAPLLSHIAPERIRAEFFRFLGGAAPGGLLLEYRDVVSVFFPSLRAMDGFQQHNPHHCYSVLEHTAHALDAAVPTLAVRLAVFLHDTGKPDCFSLDENGIGHFYGHAAHSRRIAASLLRFLRCDHATRDTVLELVARHDTPIPPEPKALRRWMSRMGAERLRLLLQVQRADTLAMAPAYHSRAAGLDRTMALLDQLLEERACFRREDLAVTGRDLIRLGVPQGPEIGRILQLLLDAVIEERCPNEPEALLRLAAAAQRDAAD